MAGIRGGASGWILARRSRRVAHSGLWRASSGGVHLVAPSVRGAAPYTRGDGDDDEEQEPATPVHLLVSLAPHVGATGERAVLTRRSPSTRSDSCLHHRRGRGRSVGTGRTRSHASRSGSRWDSRMRGSPPAPVAAAPQAAAPTRLATEGENPNVLVRTQAEVCPHDGMQCKASLR